MASSLAKRKDHWTSEAYAASASFVPKLTHTLLRYLDATPADRVLDIGCGDGKFTGTYLSQVGYVLGIDASPSMIASAVEDYRTSYAEFKVVDCRYLEKYSSIANGTWSKVISNAALHWILRDESTRISTLRGIYSCLQPGGTFVFEMGGHGNVPEVLTALIFTLVQHGISTEKAREVSPWFFPSEAWMREALESVGFHVEHIETEYRPTEMTSMANGGLAGWVRLMGAQFLEILSAEKREAAIQQVCDILQTVVTTQDGRQWLGYVRLRGVAKRV